MRFRIRKLLHLSLFLIFAASAWAQQQGGAGESASDVERLRAHITYLASDKLEGRRTGTDGAKGAARYIAGVFAQYKLRPGVSPSPIYFDQYELHGAYMQRFPFVAGVALGKNNAMLLTPRAAKIVPGGETAPRPETSRAASLDLRLEEDWMPLGFSSNSKVVEMPATFVGYGITASELNYDDYAGAEIKGRIAIAFDGTPDGDNPHGRFARQAGVRWKAIAARDHGAAALVLISRQDKFLDDRLARLRYDNSAGDAGLPVVIISRQAAARILLEGGLLAPLVELEKAWREGRSSAGSAAQESAGRRSFSVPLQNLTLNITTDLVRREAPGINVIGILEGSDPVLKREAIVIGAHYDHLGRGGEGSLASREGEVHHGADDNASGVAGLLELARVFNTERTRVRRTIIFIAFGGEEEGLLGSNFYVNHPVVPLAQTVAMINLDMIGRMKDDRLIIGGVGTSPEWRAIVEKANRPVKLNLPVVSDAQNERRLMLRSFALTLNEDGYGPSDHASFYARQVPVLFLWTGTHEDYHKPSDTADKINYEGEARLLSFVREVVRSVDVNDRRPAYTVTKSESTARSTGFRVYLGTIPNYADASVGLVLDGVRKDSPAERAGLKAGDRIVKIAGRDVRNVYDYTYALGEMKAGQEYEVEVVRAEGQTLKLKITPTGRQ